MKQIDAYVYWEPLMEQSTSFDIGRPMFLLVIREDDLTCTPWSIEVCAELIETAKKCKCSFRLIADTSDAVAEEMKFNSGTRFVFVFGPHILAKGEII